MNEASNRQIRKFNPGTFQSDEELIEQFVVRNRELEIALEVLRANIDSPSCQHLLVVAPRGRGKTMLLARATAEIRTNDELAGRLLPVRFMEESQEIFNIADFWLETLFHLARESAALDPELARELRETHADLSTRWREQSLEAHARAAVLSAADRLDRKLVLMVENLHSLCESVDEDFGWKLRGVLQSEPQIVLLASATSRFEGLDDAEQPFFELFRIIGLEPLTTEECRRLWQVVSGDAVSGREIRPLQILTGGSPRLLVIIAGFAQHHSLRQLMEELVTLIDEHTEYFRSHLEVLAKTERRVYLAVIDLWRPSSTAEIAARARMDVRTVSTMLGRLVERGAVTAEGSGRKRLYAAAERLYSIYYKLRRERDEAAIVENLIRFMVVFYNKSERTEMFQKLIQEAVESAVIREGLDRAAARIPEFENLYSGMMHTSRWEHLVEEIATAFKGGDFQKVIETVDRTLAVDSANQLQASESIIAWLLLRKADSHQALGDIEAAITTYEETVERFGNSNRREVQWYVAAALGDIGNAQEKLGDFATAIVAYDEVIKRFGENSDPNLLFLVAGALLDKGNAQEKLGDFETAIVAYDEVIKRFGETSDPSLLPRVADALLDKGNAQVKLGDFEAAIEAYDEMLERFGTSDAPEFQWRVALALVNKGDARRELDDPEEAIAAYDVVIKRFGEASEPNVQLRVSYALLEKGNALRELGDIESAIAAYNEVVERFGNINSPEIQERVAVALVFKGIAREKLGDIEAAIAAYEEVLKRFRDSSDLNIQWWVAAALVNKSIKQTQSGRPDEALHTCEELEQRLGIFLSGEEEIEFRWRVMHTRAMALLLKGKHQAAMEAFRSAYYAFVLDNEKMTQEMLWVVPDLIAAGASAHELVEILTSDEEKSDTLAPLIVALRQYSGETVRAPAEVIEVAADILKHIEEKAAQGVSGIS